MKKIGLIILGPISVVLAVVVGVALAATYNNLQGHSLSPGPGDTGMTYLCLINDPSCTDLTSVPPQKDGTIGYCKDCQQLTICSGGGAGAYAKHIAGQWSCVDSINSGGGGSGGTPGGANHAIQLNNADVFAGIVCGVNQLLTGGGTLADPTCTASPTVTAITAATATITNAIVSTMTVVSGTVSNYMTIAHLTHDGTLNVRGYPYLATGDGTTDDLAAVQKAIYDACNTTNPPTGTPLLTATAQLYLPAGQYMHSKPLRVPCQNFTWYGDGPHFTKLKQSYAGDAVLADSWGTNHAAISATDFGTGNMLTVPSGGNVGAPVDLGEYANAPNPNNFATKCAASGCGVAIIYKPTNATDTNTVIYGSFPASPGTGNGMYKFTYGGTNLTPEIRIATSGGTLLFTCPLQIISTTQVLEWDWDKTTYYAWAGQPGGLMTACGATQASANPPLQGVFENMLSAGGNFQFWPHGSSTQQTTYGGTTYSIQLETGPLHTVAWTAGAGKLANDANTYILENFDTSLDGFQMAYRGAEVSPSIYLTVWGSGNIGYVSGMVMHDMELCVSNFTFHGLHVNDSNNSLFYNLGCGNAYYGGFSINRQNFNSVFRDMTAFGGHFGLAMGDNFANGIIQDFQADGIDGACSVTSGGGGSTYKDDHSRCTDRGGLTYGRIENQNAGAEIDSWSIDQEGGSEPQFVTSILMNAPSAPYVFDLGNVDTRNSAPYVKHVGSASPGSTFKGFIFNTFGASAPASSLIQFSGTGSLLPYHIENCLLPTGNSGATAKIPLSNLGPWSVVLDDGSFTPINNNASTATVINELVKTTGAPATATALLTTDVSTIGVCKQYCGTTGTAEIQSVGPAQLLMDATTVVAGDWVIASGTTAATGKDTGVTGAPTSAPPANAIGYALETGAGSVTRAVYLTLSKPTPTSITSALINSCKADITLAAGVGTFTNACVTSALYCDSRDITTPANLCIPAAPGSGSVGLTGTGTDVCRTVCQ